MISREASDSKCARRGLVPTDRGCRPLPLHELAGDIAREDRDFEYRLGGRRPGLLQVLRMAVLPLKINAELRPAVARHGFLLDLKAMLLRPHSVTA